MATIKLSESLNNVPAASSLSGSESFVVVQGGIGKKAAKALVEAILAAAVSDGDKGDITVSGSGATWVIDANAVTLAKIADMATASFLGRDTAGTGDPEVLSIATVKAMLNLAGSNTGDQTIILSGDASGSGTGSITITIGDDKITFAKMQDIATASFLGRNTAGTGDPETLPVATAKTMLGLSGTNSGDQTITLTGDVTGSGAGSFAATIAAGAVGPTQLASTAVTPGSYVGADITVDADGRLTAAASGTYPFPMAEVFGMTISNNVTDATNDIDITAGKRRDSTDAQNIVGAASTKRLDAAWAVGTGNGGLDTGSIANTTYHVFAIKRSDTGVVDYLFSASATAPTMPANYGFKRRIGSIVRAAGAIVLFFQKGDDFWRNTPQRDVAVSNLGTTATLYTLEVPVGITVTARLSGLMAHGTLAVALIITSPSVADVAPSPPFTGFISPANTFTSFGTLVLTNTSGQIRVRSDQTSTTFQATNHGWIDDRGKNE